MNKEDLIQLKIAVTLEQHVAVKLNSGQSMIGVPKWNANPDQVQIKSTEGAAWVLLHEIEHVTRIISMPV
ncbi:hypothetical protein DCC85_13950 [Paenibacillus sp. CAA11]|uniref:hypothetical protein n=1 Tax=Paenibacillus sp. CAA11 TaxID=1532905 RepID=UPI000D3AA0F9|nr:hypothetical protein [Paenibacillus sp. CAA11]AWB46957.1 hypothetical protein DCC85_13950 [Paenibacillus sp. CAA11]